MNADITGHLIVLYCKELRNDFWKVLETHKNQKDILAVSVSALWFSYQDLLEHVGCKNGLMNYFAALIFIAPCQYQEILEDVFKSFVVNSLDESVTRLSERNNEVFQFWSQLNDMNLMYGFNSTVSAVFHEVLDVCMKRFGDGNYDTPVLSSLLKWQKTFVHLLSHPQDKSLIKTDKAIMFGNEIIDMTYLHRRASDLYDIITEYPDSICATMEIRSALVRTGRQDEFAHLVRSILQQRLLHAGANTSQIIDVYSSTLKFLRFLRFDKYLITVATDIIRFYLRSREDTVRCIVHNLSNNSPSALDHVRESRIHPDYHALNVNFTSSPTNGDIYSNNGDVLSTLMSIYGSSRIFITQFKRMLAARLLEPHRSVEFDDEVRKLELLKIRFGDSPLDDCEVMLRDFRESSRLDLQAKNQSITVISHVFWPPIFSKSHVKLHKRLIELQDEYDLLYKKIKAPRQLRWNSEIGSVKIQIEFAMNSKEDYTVSPLEASLILFFEDADILDAKSLAQSLNTSQDIIRKHMNVWITNGIISIKDNSTYILNAENRKSVAQTNIDIEPNIDLSNQAPPPNNDATSSNAPVLKSYILGMIRNLGSLSLESVHNMLQLFLNDDTHAEVTMSELAQILDLLCAEELLQNNGGNYSIRRDRSQDPALN